eukprot:scaffold29432_cov153-Skeletonema_marinoi.AAC.3
MPSSSSQHLSALPVEVWSMISDYTTAPATERDGPDTQRTCLSALRCTSRAFNSLLTSDEYYQARVADAIKTLDELDTARRAAAGPCNSSGSCRVTGLVPNQSADIKIFFISWYLGRRSKDGIHSAILGHGVI